MEKIYKSAQELIGRTPLIELERLEQKLGLGARLLAKLEAFNPAGSSKDRAAVSMLDDAEERGLISLGATIIEPTSGNTGIALAFAAVLRGYEAIIVMPDTMSPDRIKLISAYGARVVLTDGKNGMKGSIEMANKLAREIPNSFIPSQFTNPANPLAHFKTTGPEIYSDTCGNIDAFIAGVGTGGTITGVGRYLKSQNPSIRIIAAEPDKSPVLSGGDSASHGIQGIGAGFIPDTLDTSIIDEVIRVSDEDSCATARLIARTEGLLVGISSGATAFAAMSLANRPDFSGKTIVTLFPDGCDRYLSMDLYG
ncbi:MAG: cysteine synthase A [Clostridia bacterium]|nr:cysteine synthase A [Clostridia bacterium]